MTNKIQSTINLRDIDSAYLELFILDCTMLKDNAGNPGQKWYFTPYRDPSGAIVFDSQLYIPLPVQASGFETHADGTQASPTMAISNVDRTLQSLLISLGDCVGATVTRIRTFAKHLDNGSDPDPNATLPKDVCYIAQKTSHNSTAITWKLRSHLDRLGIMLPRRQILREGVNSNAVLVAPAIARYRKA